MADAKKSSIVTNTVHLLNLKNPERTGKRLKLSFQRTPGLVTQLKSGKTMNVSLSLLDISEAGVGFFSEQLLLKGSAIEIILNEPKVLKLVGLVAWSVPIKSGIHSAKFAFRSGMQFQFENEVERSALVDFIQKIAIDPVDQYKNKVAARAEAAAKAAADAAATPPADVAAQAAAVPVPPTTAVDPATVSSAPVDPAAVASPVVVADPAVSTQAEATASAIPPAAAGAEVPVSEVPKVETAAETTAPSVAEVAPVVPEAAKPSDDGSGQNQAA